MINKMLHSKYKNIWIILSFLLLAIISILIMSLSHKTTGMGDTPFHWQRILELKYDIQHWNIPKVALNTFNYDGSAVMTMYPYLTLLPFAIFSILIKSTIVLFYFMFALYIFIAMIISFYSSKDITKNDLTSYLFAVIYGLIGNFGLNNNDFGVNLVIIILPLAIFGMASFIKYNHWLKLSIGMSLILFSNLLAFIITTLILIIFLIINYQKLTFVKIRNLIKATILSLLTTAIFLIPFIKISLLNNLQIPQMFAAPNMMDKIQHSLNITQYVSNNVGMNINYIATITIIGGLFFIRGMKGITKQFYLIGSLLFIFYSSGTIWNLINNSPLHFMTIIQFPTRFFFISQILLDFVFTMIVTKYINYNSQRQLSKTTSLILIFIVLSQMAMQWCFYNENIANTTDNVITKQNENQYHNMTFDNHTDYYPNNSINILGYIQSNNSSYNVNKQFKINHNGNGEFSFYVPIQNVKELNLPFLYYHGIKYKVKIDKREIPFYDNQNSLITINNIPKGYHNIQISVKNSWDYILGYIMFIMSLIIYSWLLIKYLKGKFQHGSKKLRKLP